MENREAKRQTNLRPAFPLPLQKSILAFPKYVAQGRGGLGPA